MVRWRGRRQSGNVEDRRGEGAPSGFPNPFGRGGRGGARGGIKFPFPGGGGGRKGGIGLVGMIVIVGVMLLFGVDPRVLLEGGMQPSQGPGAGIPDIRLPGGKTTPASKAPRRTGTEILAPKTKGKDDLAKFVSVVLADTEDVWHAIFRKLGKRYKEPKLVLFSGGVRSACGTAQSAMGPFYCPADHKLYVDLSFYKEMKTRFGASGDFAQAYVIAHEVGHHVQTLFGISRKVQEAKTAMSQRQSNALQVRMELQADCFAGIWANHADRAKQILEAGDIEEGLNAASAIGDDNIQRRTQGRVVPDAFTHGSSKQRVRWFKRGIDTGDLNQCDSFNAKSL